MKNVNALARVALRLYNNEGGSYFEIDDILDFMEQEVDNCDGEDITDEDIIRSVVRNMLDMES
jgi:polyhydroxyalkanoate synthesis regulator protein